ncbi:hypothetical protein KCP74_20610 [Salmonella enterica subsp. enterica]|nr:hypothetical protein KCP74_20610 [Salmonella enterica subsp. enterica]
MRWGGMCAPTLRAMPIALLRVPRNYPVNANCCFAIELLAGRSVNLPLFASART